MDGGIWGGEGGSWNHLLPPTPDTERGLFFPSSVDLASQGI